MKKFIVPVLLTLCAMSFITAGCVKKQPSEPGPVTPTRTATAVVQNTSTVTSTPSVTQTITATATCTATEVCTIAFGNTDESENDDWVGNYIIGSVFTLPQDYTVSSLTLRLESPGNFAAAIYADVSGAPGTKIAESAGAAGTAGWNTVEIPGTLLSSGSTYWLVFIEDATGVGSCDICAGTYGYTPYAFSDVLASGFPASIYLAAGWNTVPGQAHIYASYCQ